MYIINVNLFSILFYVDCPMVKVYKLTKELKINKLL